MSQEQCLVCGAWNENSWCASCREPTITTTRAVLEKALHEEIVAAALWAMGETRIESGNLRSLNAERFVTYSNDRLSRILAELEQA